MKKDESIDLFAATVTQEIILDLNWEVPESGTFIFKDRPIGALDFAYAMASHRPGKKCQSISGAIFLTPPPRSLNFHCTLYS